MELAVNVEQGREHTGNPLLELSKVTKFFGGLAAVQDVDLQIWPREIISVIGPNGAGKTTVFNLITGIYRPSSGDIRLNDKSLAGLNPDQVLRRGIARTFQNIRLFNNMTVLENVLVGQHLRFPDDLASITFHLPNYRRREREAHDRAMDLLSFFGPSLLARKDDYASTLPYAD